MKNPFARAIGLLVTVLWLSLNPSILANLPGGGTGTGPNVTLTANGNGTVTMANGTVSIVILTSDANINDIYYIYNNSGTMVTNQLLAGGFDGGKLYWENAGFGSGNFTYSVVANNGNYCEVDLFANSTTNGTMDVHFSMLRGSPGFYVTPIWSHRPGDVAMTDAEGRDNIYVGSIFNWMSVNALHDFETGVNQPLVPAFISPQEDELVTAGPMEGIYFDKYKYGADFGGQNGGQKVWGWSSVSDASIGFTGANIGLWHVLSSVECYNGGPMKTELMEGESAYTLNMMNGSHYGLGQNFNLSANEVWSKTYGPYFIYCNNVTNTLANPVQASRALFSDAQAQAAAEQSAWPYSWFTNANYAAASQRGAVSGQIVINDSGNPNASASNLWVGIVQEPMVADGVYDFQEWCKAYEFWTKCDAQGNFIITNVIAASNYTLYAFGPGASGTFMSQTQNGGSPPFLYDLPASQFNVTISSQATNGLGTIVWTPKRVGPTVFEIGYPDRTSGKFRHGDDWFVGDIGPSPIAPSPIWTKFLDYPFDFPNGPDYVIGQSRWSTDWNFIQPEVIDQSGNYNASSSTIQFNLPAAPANGANVSLYLGLAAAYSGPTIVSVNGNNLGTVSGVTATPVTPLSSMGYNPAGTPSDVSVREGNHGAFSDERITFPASLLNVGQNIINIQMRKVNSSESFIMYDYIRLEMTGYVPPAPASVTAYAGNNCNLVCWPVVPGATSYNILRSTTPGSAYLPITNDIIGPVCGSGPANAAYIDSTAVNGTTYYYVVQSVNPVNASGDSPQSPGTTPSEGISTNAPSAPGGLTVSSINNSVTLNWTASPGANFYTIQRGTVVNSTVANTTDYVPFYLTLNNTTTGTTFTDASGTLGCTYSYLVTAASAGGTSSNTTAVNARPVPPPPATPPANVSINDTITATNQSTIVRWSPVSGAVGYILFRSTSPGGPFVFPGNYVMSMTTTSWTDTGLNRNTIYYYSVMAMNAGGVSGNSSVVGTTPAAPASLGAFPGNSQITLSWSASSGATNYAIERGTSSGNETTTVANTANTTYTDTNLVNGTTYYYVVIATGPTGISGDSPEANATPGTIITGARSLTWVGDGVANLWNVSGAANWQTNGTATIFNNGDKVIFDDTGSNNVPVTLAGTLQPALVTISASKNYSMNGTGSISGTNALVKSNTGALTISTTNTYTGGTMVSNGLVTFTFGLAIPSSGTLTLANTGAVVVVTASGLPNVLVGGTNAITGNGNSGTGIASLDDEAALTLLVSGGSKVFDLTGTMTGSGTLTLGGTSGMTMRFNGTSGDGNAVFNLGTAANFASVRNTSTGIALGGLAGGPTAQLQGNNNGGGPNMTYVIGGAAANAEFDGTIINGTVGTVAVTKTGNNTQTFTNANAYSAGTIINGGTLLVNNSGGSGTGTGAVTVNGGALGGTGIISGAVTVNLGGSLAPGNPLGTLTLSNNLNLNAGSLTLVQIQHSPLTNDVTKIIGTLVEGGTLNASNIGMASFAAGDSFKLFNAASYSGRFAGFMLPALNAGLVWNTNLLGVSGTLAVATYSPPNIGNLAINSGNLNISGSGGIAYWNYYVLASTNLASSWAVVATNQFDANGNFIFTNTLNQGSQQVFYKLQLQ